MTRVVITGAGGMLGCQLVATAPVDVEVVAVDIAEGDLSTPEGVAAAVETHRPDIVVHTAAWTDVDGCERDPARAWRVNALATRLVAGACRRLGARLVYISTDYVFDGGLGRPYAEADAPCPVNVYGETKLAGELAAASVDDHLIMRTQWLFGPGRSNFVEAVLRKALRGEPLIVVADQWGCPTYTVHLAPMVWRGALAGWRGVLHAAGRGIATWHDVAAAALEAAEVACKLMPCSLDEWPSSARRPRYAPLALNRWQELSGSVGPTWRQGVGEYAKMMAGVLEQQLGRSPVR
ncbi:MAG: dTDP-4-dehydrorhamnose reductase [Armatimonadetes bacterium]|nr:dTDP-4-dehydrorhamnose reductase [Armatimonadota bacterium]